MEQVQKAFEILFIFCAIFLAVTIFFCLVRAIAGPRLTDRLVAINIISCKVVILFAVLAVYFNEYYLLDIDIAYALISFLAIIILYKQVKESRQDKRERELPELKEGGE